jgi:hypothetical protein
MPPKFLAGRSAKDFNEIKEMKDTSEVFNDMDGSGLWKNLTSSGYLLLRYVIVRVSIRVGAR